MFSTIIEQTISSTLSSQILRSSIHLNQGDKIDENLMCNICSELVIEPKECEECENIFCSQCINDWIKKSSTCPFKCPSQPMKLRNPHKFVRNALSQIKYSCLNKAKGCNEIMGQSSLMGHLKECNFTITKCQNQNCDFSGIKSEIQDHVNQCQYRIISCEKCNMKFLSKFKNSHDCISSLQLKVEQLEIRDKEKDQQLQILTQKLSQLQQQFVLLYDFVGEFKRESKKDKNKCHNGHDLIWSSGSYSTCQKCMRQNQSLRYICQQCRVGYCTICRPVMMLKKDECPNGHRLDYQQVPKTTITCDICRKKPAEVGGGNWADRNCDFDVCNQCYDQLKKQLL